MTRLQQFAILALVVCSCKPAQTTLQSNVYEEELSSYRKVPDFASISEPEETDNGELQPASAPPAHHLRGELDSVIAVIVDRNIERAYWDGYIIQVYSGLSRETAYAARSTMRQLKPDLDTRIEYYQPSYRVKCGAYFDQLKAHKVHQELLAYFPDALLLPEKIQLDVEPADQ